jgi:hypothetical protein
VLALGLGYTVLYTLAAVGSILGSILVVQTKAIS